MALLILWAPVWARSSRLSRTVTPRASERRRASKSGVGPADEVGQPSLELGRKLRIVPGAFELLGQFGQGRHQSLGSEPPAVFAKAPIDVGTVQTARSQAAPRTAFTKAEMSS